MTELSDHSPESSPDLQSLAEAARQAITEGGFRVIWQSDPAQGRSCLTVGFPRQSESLELHCSLSTRLVWWSRGIPDRRWVAVVSSRIGARHDQYQWWYDLMRTTALRLDTHRECLVTVAGTTTHKAAQRAAELFGIGRISISIDDQQGMNTRQSADGQPEPVDETNAESQMLSWLSVRLAEPNRRDEADAAGEWRAEVSPRFGILSGMTDSPSSGLPVRDRLTLAVADRCYVLACRRNGNIYQAVSDQLKSALTGVPILVANSPGTPASCLETLTQSGAVPWFVDGMTDRDVPTDPALHAGDACEAVVSNGPLDAPDEWLCHWTRPRTGPWPGQPESDYLDELLLGCRSANRSALATLLRIAEHRVVLATAVRDALHAVSFTEVPLHEFRSRRVYRRHRRRYDFEPWGVAVRRSVLETLGARRVTYGERSRDRNDQFQSSVWFQPASDRSGRIDWREEREWRLPFDLQLGDLPHYSICLFVNSKHELEMLRGVCDWPSEVVPDCSS